MPRISGRLPCQSSDGAYTNMNGTMKATIPRRTAVRATPIGFVLPSEAAVNAASATGGVIAVRQAK